MFEEYFLVWLPSSQERDMFNTRRNAADRKGGDCRIEIGKVDTQIEELRERKKVAKGAEWREIYEAIGLAFEQKRKLHEGKRRQLLAIMNPDASYPFVHLRTCFVYRVDIHGQGKIDALIVMRDVLLFLYNGFQDESVQLFDDQYVVLEVVTGNEEPHQNGSTKGTNNQN